ncbi:MAG: SufE family protein [Wenzhouxiangellaceae bacterium]
MSDIDQVQQEIIDEFAFLDDWLDKYQHIIDLGRRLPPLEAHEMTDDALLEGCQSQVWLHARGDAERLEFRANSDAAIVSGLIWLLLEVYSGRSAQEILDAEPRFIRELDLSEHLSPTRANGLNAMLQAIHGHARHALEQAHA